MQLNQGLPYLIGDILLKIVIEKFYQISYLFDVR